MDYQQEIIRLHALTCEAEDAKKFADEQYAAAKHLEEQVKQLKREITVTMLKDGVDSHKDDVCTVWVTRSGKKSVVQTVETLDDVEERFIRVKKEMNKEEVRKELERGIELPFARIEECEQFIRYKLKGFSE